MCFVYRVFGEDGADAALGEFLSDGLERFDAKTKRTYAEHGGGVGNNDDGSGPKASTDRYKQSPFRIQIPNYHPITDQSSPASTYRFRADLRTTARISPYMRHGELSPRTVYHAAKEIQAGSRRARARSVAVFLRRLAWRDLAYWSLWRFPHLCDEPLRPQYATQWWALPWDPNGRGDSVSKAVDVSLVRWDRSRKTVVSNDAALRAWQFGKTGYPLVDAAMRELWVTGYMPNYTRHVVAGFLIEYLNVDWRHGQLWFHDTLVDADVAIQVQTVSLRIQIPNHHPITTQSLTNHPISRVLHVRGSCGRTADTAGWTSGTSSCTRCTPQSPRIRWANTSDDGARSWRAYPYSSCTARGLVSLESHPSILKYPITNQLLTKPPPCKYSGGAGDVSRRRGRRARSRLSKENRDGPRGRQARGAQGGDRRAKSAPGVRAARRERGVAAARAGSNRAMHHAGGLPNVSLFLFYFTCGQLE